ncbi:MAG TPA: hypothetical protein VN428_07885 [Bryobacteraceae bacterium]|nr:hypothetical protein [Bryobacteraceae bacterium]
MRSIEVGPLARPDAADAAGEIAQLLDRELHLPRTGGAGGERERMPAQGKRRGAQREPGKLAGPIRKHRAANATVTRKRWKYSIRSMPNGAVARFKRGQGELHAHHRQACIAQHEREVPP